MRHILIVVGFALPLESVAEQGNYTCHSFLFNRLVVESFIQQLVKTRHFFEFSEKLRRSAVPRKTKLVKYSMFRTRT